MSMGVQNQAHNRL